MEGPQRAGRQSRWGRGRGWEAWRQGVSSLLGALWAPAPSLWALEGRGQQGAERIRGGPTWDERTVAVSRDPHRPLTSLKCPPFPPAAQAPVLSLFEGKEKRNSHEFLNNALCYAISPADLSIDWDVPSAHLLSRLCRDVTTSERPSWTSSPSSTPVLHC